MAFRGLVSIYGNLRLLFLGKGPYSTGQQGTARQTESEMTMTSYNITARKSGHLFGAYEGATADEAVEAYARDAGYSDFEDLATSLSKSVEEAREELSVTLPPTFAIQFKSSLGGWEYYGAKRDCTFTDRAEAERVMAELEAADEEAGESSEWRVEESA